VPNLNYVKGRAGEYELMRIYEQRGYSVYRCAGSHSLVDVIAIPSNNGGKSGFLPVLIQAKRNCKPAKKELEQFRALNVLAKKVIAVRKDREGWKEEIIE